MYNFPQLHKMLGSAITEIYHQKIRIIFPLFWETKFAIYCCVLTDLSIFREHGKKCGSLESRIAFCRLFIVRVKKVCYESKVQRELLQSYFHCTLEWLCPQAPTTSFRLMALRDRIERKCHKETSHPVNSKMQQQKTIFNFVLCQVRLILFNTNLVTKNDISYVKTVLNTF